MIHLPMWPPARLFSITSSSATAAYLFNPTTGFSDNTYQYRTELVLSEMNLNSFQDIILGVNCLLSETLQ